jgi:hypothetical protein
MLISVLHFLAIISIALSLVPGGAHLIEMPNKMPMNREEYLVAQRLYRGWALAGIALLTALVTTLSVTIFVLAQRAPFVEALLAFLLMLTTLVTFVTHILPVNKATKNWTVAPEGWERLRAQCERTHALNAVLTLIALAAMVIAALTWSD